jgi:hypothetical protein
MLRVPQIMLTSVVQLLDLSRRRLLSLVGIYPLAPTVWFSGPVDGLSLRVHTIIPNVQAVSAIFMAAVSINRNTFSHIAVGLYVHNISPIFRSRHGE